jgi:hypothetical protein
VAAQFDEAEIVELTLMSGYFNMFNRVMDSLNVPLENEFEVDKIKRSIRVEPERVRQYLQTLLDNWPDAFPEPAPDS